MKFRTILFILLLLMTYLTSCKEKNSSSFGKIPRGEYQIEYIQGNPKKYVYNTYLPIIRGNIIKKGRVLNGKIKGMQNKSYGYAGYGSKGFFDLNGNLTKQYVFTNGHYHPTKMFNRKFRNRDLLSTSEFTMPDSIHPHIKTDNIFQDSVLVEVKKHEYLRNFAQRQDTTVLTSKIFINYDSHNKVFKKEETKYEYYNNDYSKIKTKRKLDLTHKFSLTYENKTLVKDEHDIVFHGDNRIYNPNFGRHVDSKSYYPNGGIKRLNYKTGGYENFDENGYCTISTVNSFKGFYEYSNYDKEGNWLKVIFYQEKDGLKIPEFIGERVIEYY